MFWVTAGTEAEGRGLAPVRRAEDKAWFTVMFWSGALDWVGPGWVSGAGFRVRVQVGEKVFIKYGAGVGGLRLRLGLIVWAGAPDWVGMGRAGAATGCRPGFGWGLKARVWGQEP
eukprot:g15626.t1